MFHHLIRRNTGRLANEVFALNPIVSSKQQLSGLKIANSIIATVSLQTKLFVALYVCANYTSRINHAPFLYSTITAALSFVHLIALTCRKYFIQNISFILGTFCASNWFSNVNQKVQRKIWFNLGTLQGTLKWLIYTRCSCNIWF